MTNDEILEQAEFIKDKFDKGTVPMTAEEKRIVNLAYQIKLARLVNETQSAFGYNFIDED